MKINKLDHSTSYYFNYLCKLFNYNEEEKVHKSDKSTQTIRRANYMRATKTERRRWQSKIVCIRQKESSRCPECRPSSLVVACPLSPYADVLNLLVRAYATTFELLHEYFLTIS